MAGFAPAGATCFPDVRKVGKGTGQSFASAEATYFRCAAKVSKDAPEGKPFRMGFPPEPPFLNGLKGHCPFKKTPCGTQKQHQILCFDFPLARSYPKGARPFWPLGEVQERGIRTGYILPCLVRAARSLRRRNPLSCCAFACFPCARKAGRRRSDEPLPAPAGAKPSLASDEICKSALDFLQKKD